MKTIILDWPDALRAAADEIAALLREKPGAVLAFSTGRTMRDLFAALGERFKAGSLSLAGATVFAVTEFEDVPAAQTARQQLLTELCAVTDLPPERLRFPHEGYDDEIAAAGGLDLAVLGLGVNAHIGYNEPATPFASRTHRQKLTDKTRAQLAGSFGSPEAAPTTAWTMGIFTLISAKRLFVLARGAEKAWAVFQMLYARDDSVIPAAFLQLPPAVTVWLDHSAAEKL